MTSPLHRPAHRGTLLAAAAVAATLLLGACGGPTARSAGPTASSTSASSSASASASAPSAATTRTAQVVPGAVAVDQVAPKPLQPVRIRIPAIGVDAGITHLGIGRSGAIDVPQHPLQAGWLTTTPAPGQRGPAVIAGHVDSTTGPAVFYRLSSLKVGDLIEVTRRDGGTARFTVDGVRVYAKDAFPTADVYGPAPGPVLRLITCGGDYVKAHGGYQSNVVVYAS